MIVVVNIAYLMNISLQVSLCWHVVSRYPLFRAVFSQKFSICW